MDTALTEHDHDNRIADLQKGDTQINWLELARFAAAGKGQADLGRGVNRLATLAAAVHRGAVRTTTSTVSPEREEAIPGCGVQGRTHQAQPITEDGR